MIVTQFSGDLDTVSDKQEAIAGLPILLLLFGLVGAAGEYRHRTAAPAALAAGRDRALAAARAGGRLRRHGPRDRGADGRGGAGARPAAAGRARRAGRRRSTTSPLVAGGSLIAAALSAIMGVAAGALVRNQVAGVVGALILAFVVSPLLAIIDETAVEFTPFGAAFALAGDPAGGGHPVVGRGRGWCWSPGRCRC